jgi:hypothetical protein
LPIIALHPCLMLQKVGKGGDEIQQYRCSRPDCRKEYNSLQVRLDALGPVGAGCKARAEEGLQQQWC